MTRLGQVEAELTQFRPACGTERYYWNTQMGWALFRTPFCLLERQGDELARTVGLVLEWAVN